MAIFAHGRTEYDLQKCVQIKKKNAALQPLKGLGI